MTNSNPTLEDVAKAAGVSTATISRFMNHKSSVAEATRRKISQAIDTLGYTPNLGGRFLATRKTNIVGAVIPSLANSVFAVGIQAFQEALAKAGMTLLVASTNYEPDAELEQIKSLLAHGASGLLIVGSNRPERTQEFLTSRKVPTLSVWNTHTDQDALYVGFDNFKASARLTQMVIDYGHTAIAIVSGFTQGNDRARDRLSGMISVIEHVDNDARLVVAHETKYSFDHAAKAFEAVMSHTPRPTVIMAGNDVLAAGMIDHAKRLGFDLPGQLSITGFDDIALAQFVEPGLTTVRVPQVEMGTRAAEVLLQEMREPGSAKSIELQTMIIQRTSLAEPPE